MPKLFRLAALAAVFALSLGAIEAAPAFAHGHKAHAAGVAKPGAKAHKGKHKGKAHKGKAHKGKKSHKAHAHKKPKAH